MTVKLEVAVLLFVWVAEVRDCIVVVLNVVDGMVFTLAVVAIRVVFGFIDGAVADIKNNGISYRCNVYYLDIEDKSEKNNWVVLVV